MTPGIEMGRADGVTSARYLRWLPRPCEVPSMSLLPVTDRCVRPTARLSQHARQRCQAMGLRTKAVKAVVRDPEMDTSAPNGGRLLVGGALAVISDADANEVVTVLWAQGESRAGGPVRRTG